MFGMPRRTLMPRALALLAVPCLLAGGLAPHGAQPGLAAPPAHLAALSPTLSVRAVSPSPNATDVITSTTVLVAFDRPVAPLVGVAQAQLPSPVVSDPPLAGHGQWVTSAIYRYQVGALHAATTYHVRVAAGLRAIDGTRLQQDFSWSFSTLRPAVLNVSPPDGYGYAVPRPAVTVQFNQRMDHAGAEAAFMLRDGLGNRLPGAFSWPDSVTLRFQPAAPLVRSATYIATEGPAARSAEGPLPMTRPAHWQFAVAPLLRVAGSTPANGAVLGPNDQGSGVEVDFSAPVDETSAIQHVSLSPDVPGRYISFGQDDLNLLIYGNFAPSTRYTVTVRSGLRARAGDTLTTPYSFHFTTAPLSPALGFVTGGVATYDAYRPILLSLQGINPGAITYSLYRLNQAAFVSGLNNQYNLSQNPPPSSSRILSFTKLPNAPLNKTVAIQAPLALPGQSTLPPGYYFVQAQGSGQAVDEQLVLVTRTGITLKVSQRQVLAWATDLASGRPVAGLPLTVTTGQGYAGPPRPLIGAPGGSVPPSTIGGQTVVAAGRTGADGTLLLNVSGIGDQQSLVDMGVVVLGTNSGDAIAASSNWNSGVSPYDYGLSAASYQPVLRLTVYTDRPIYRPAQVVHARGIVRADHDGQYSLVAGPISVMLSDPNGKIVGRRTVTLDRFGAFSADFTLAANSSLGNYQLGATKGQYSANASFQVAEYKKPTFNVTVTAPRSTYSLGQYVSADVQVSYYFGGPVAHAKVHWSMLGYDTIFYSPLFSDYAFGSYDPAAYNLSPIGPIPPYSPGYTLFQGDGVTDAQGKLHLHLPARLPKGRLVQNYSLEANVTDLDNSPVAGNTSVTVYNSAFQIGLNAPAQVIDPGKPQQISVVTVGNDGITPAAHEAVRVAFYRRTYSNVVKVNPDGSVSQNYVPHDTFLGAQTTTTDVHGKGSVSFTAPQGGEYHLSATSTDRFGNHVESSIELYAGGEKPIDWGFQPQGHIRLVTDKETYHTGDVAHVLVTAPYPNMLALISIERGQVLSYQVRRLSGTGVTLDLPIPASYLPDTYVSVVVEQGASASGAPPVWRMGYARIHVDPKERAIRLSVTAPKSRVAPGQSVPLHIHAVDYQGNPVAGSFSLSVVDQAALALAGDSGSGADLLDAFYGLRELGVFTSDTLNISPEQLITKRPLQPRQPLMFRAEVSSGAVAPQAAARPGFTANHAAAGKASGPTISVRQNFADTAYWNPAITTDAQGNAVVTVPLPDNLTTWHILGQGISATTLVGVAVTNLVATKDLVLRPLLPRFFTLGDKAMVGAAVNNTTGAAMAVSLHLLLADGAPSAAPAPAGSRMIHLAAGAEQDVTWPISLTALGTATVQVQAIDSANQATNDAVQLALPVQENSTPENVATAGDAGANTQEAVKIPAGIEPNEGSLSITLEPTLASGLRVGADFLANYPYESSIDLAARAQGYAELGRLPARASVLTAKERAGLSAQIANQVQQLYQMQHGDGGFGWWTDDPLSDPYITVYIVRALTVVRDQGYAVDATVLSNAVAYLESQTQSPAALNAGANYAANLQAEIVYAITRYGRGADVATLATQLFSARYLLDRFAEADLAVALSAMPSAAARADAHTLLADLISAAKISGASAHWEEGSYDWGALDSDIITTANVLDALLAIDPHNPLIPNTVRWIMAARTANAWESTEATSRSVVGLVDYILHSGELNGNYHYTVHLNGSLWGNGAVNPTNLTQNRTLSQPLGTKAPAGSTQGIAVGRDNLPGHGQLHYVVRLQYYLPVNHIAPVTAGVGVTRHYLTPGGNSAALGSTIRVRLTITAPQDLFYTTLEDPLPAGCESVDTSLRTTSQLAQIQSQSTIPAGTSDLTWYVTHTDLRDNRTVLFLDYLPAGAYQYTYLMHCTTQGTFHTLPTHIQQSYFPEVFGHGAGSFFTVR
ncbi:MAG TPA: Ig-like domain-containing protein [Chloroflexota bacterium]|nr:Ig-like domain-containing protein [Chloroflexota bacterium]